MVETAALASSPGARVVTTRKPDGGVVTDLVAVEAPLEIRVGGRPLVITMRTQGHDEELAAGFLYGERVVSGGEQITSIRTEPGAGEADEEGLAAGKIGGGDRVLVELGDAPDTGAVERAQRDFRATDRIASGPEFAGDRWQIRLSREGAGPVG